MGSNGNNQKKNNQPRTVRAKTNTSIPSYLQPTGNSRGRLRNRTNNKKETTSTKRPRSSSIDGNFGKKRISKSSKRTNAKSKPRKQRNNSMDSVVSLSPAPFKRKMES